MIVIENLKKSFGNKIVLDGIDLTIPTGSSFVIMGGSGCGKSIFIKTIIGLVEADNGSRITVFDEEITRLSALERLGYSQNFGVLFQGGALFDSLPVWRNIAFFVLHQRSMSEIEAKKIALEKLAMVGLESKVAELYPVELSGGMQKRVALARAIFHNPKLIFFDEPTAGLDPIMSALISELIRKCSKQLGATTITITHDMRAASHIADEAALLFGGKFIWQGSSEEIMQTDNPYMQQFVHGLTTGPFNQYS